MYNNKITNKTKYSLQFGDQYIIFYKARTGSKRKKRFEFLFER